MKNWADFGSQKCRNTLRLRGPGGSRVDFHLFVVSYRGEWQLPGTYFGMKNYRS